MAQPAHNALTGSDLHIPKVHSYAYHEHDATDDDIDDAVDKKHTRQHAIGSTSDHTGLAGTEDNLVSLSSTGMPEDSGKAKSDVHTKQHNIDATADHNGVSGADENDVMVFDASGLPKSSTQTIAEVQDHNAKQHDIDDSDRHNGITMDENDILVGDANGLPKSGAQTIAEVIAEATAGSGDMTKAVYDTDDDGIVDKSESVDDGAGNSKTAEEVKTHIDSTANPHSTTKTHVGLSNVVNTLHKLDATSAPTANDDSADGYSAGSLWVDLTNDKAYVCLDATVGAAVWTEITSGYTNLTEFVDQTAHRLFYSNAAGDVTELAYGLSNTYLKSTGVSSAPEFATPSGAGDVVGPESSVDEQLAAFDGVTGKLLKDSGKNLSDVHAKNADTSLGTQTADINMGTHKLTALSVPSSNGDSIRATTKITEVNLESAIDHKDLTNNPHSTTKAHVGLSNVTNILNKLDATVAPTVNDDSDDGYSVGSRWVDVTADKEYVCLDATVGAAVWTETTQSGGGGGSYPQYFFPAGSLNIPNNADWAVNALAPAEADEDHNALTVHAFDDTTEEGVGFKLYIPSGATNIIFRFLSRAQTAPGSAKGVVPKVYYRQVTDNGALASWNAGTELTKIDIPTNEYFQYDSQTVSLATLGLTADKYYQFELTRNPAAGDDDLVDDWYLSVLRVEFS